MSNSSMLKESVRSVSLDASAVREASTWLAATGEELGLPREQIMRLDLCLNECLANILSHGGPTARLAPVEIQLSRSDPAPESGAVLMIRDAGVEFDPTLAMASPRPRDLRDAEPGGLGLLMMHSNCDIMSYQRNGARNELSLSVHWPSDT